MESLNHLTAAEEHRPNVSWGSIFAGAVIAFVTQLVFLSLGSAIGFSAFDPGQGDSPGQSSLIAAGIYTVIVALLSLFAGGYVAGRLAGYRLRSVSTLHGLCSWGVVSAVTVLMMAMGVSRVAGTAFGIVGSGIKGLAQASSVAATNSDMNVETVTREVRQILNETGKPELNPNRMEREAKNLPAQAATTQATTGGASGGASGGTSGANVAGNQLEAKADAFDRDAVANVLSKRLGISKNDAMSLIGQSEDKANQVIGTLKARSLEAAQKGTQVAASVSWMAFLTLILGAAAAAFGGFIGGPHGYRSEHGPETHPRDYKPIFNT
jgi:hypothetical protein